MKNDEDFSLKDFLVQAKDNSSEQYKVLQDLMNSDKDLKLKTEINKPFTFSVLSVFASFLNESGFDDTAEIVEKFMREYFLLSISKKRQGRKEIIDALKSLGLSINTQQAIPQNLPMR